MKLFVLLALLILPISNYAQAAPKMKGKCAKIAAQAVMNLYGPAIDDGNLATVVSSQVTNDPFIYAVLVVLMDGSGEPFSQSLNVTFANAATCANPEIAYRN
jgi:hypothetical protein